MLRERLLERFCGLNFEPRRKKSRRAERIPIRLIDGWLKQNSRLITWASRCDRSTPRSGFTKSSSASRSACARRWTQEKVNVAMLPAGGSRIELLEATGPDSVIAKFIEKRGEGLHHVAVKVPDLAAAVERLKAGGARLLNDPRRGRRRPSLRFRASVFNGRRVAGVDTGMKPTIGIIGGSGLYSMPGFEAQEEVLLDSPWGGPSDHYIVGRLAGKEVAFLSRHGRGHRISPSELNFRANIYGFKSLGVERIISLSAVGSLKEEHAPLQFVIPDQFFDRTRGRIFHVLRRGPGGAHQLRRSGLPAAFGSGVDRPARETGVDVATGGTYLCMEGPAFSTKAESNVYRSWGMDVIGMTNLQEAKLAREAEICYVTVAMVTDYDCWHEDHDAVTVTDILANLQRNAENACKVVAATVAGMPAKRECKCGSALAHALITDPNAVPARHAQEAGAAGWQNTSAEPLAHDLLACCLDGRPWPRTPDRRLAASGRRPRAVPHRGGASGRSVRADALCGVYARAVLRSDRAARSRPACRASGGAVRARAASAPF